MIMNKMADKGTGTVSDNREADAVPVPLSVKPTYTKEYRVDFIHIDMNNRIKLSSIFNFMQDIAGIHANELGCGYDVLSKHGITWVMLRAKIHIEAYPSWGDVITIKTSTNGVDKLCAVREFEFIDASGKSVGYAITYWILYDVSGRKVVRMNHSGFELPEHLKLNYCAYEKLNRIKEQGELISESTRKAQYNDIDTNIHVNNARYIEWITDAVYDPTERLQNQTWGQVPCPTERLIKSLHVGFTSSVRLGDSVSIKTFISPGNDKKEILRIYKDDTEYLQAEIEFIQH